VYFIANINAKEYDEIRQQPSTKEQIDWLSQN
jgi:hypothetical protein